MVVSIEGGRYTQQSNHRDMTQCRLEDDCQLQGQAVSLRLFNCLTLKVKARPSFETSGSTRQTTQSREVCINRTEKKVELCYLLFHRNNNVTVIVLYDLQLKYSAS